MKTSAPSFVVVVLAIGLAAAAAPPALVNYQGVLRNASDIPLTGAYDMVFHFYSAEAAGDEILVDSHTLAAGGQVVVSGGLFNVSLGGGSVTDGTGPGRTHPWRTSSATTAPCGFRSESGPRR